MRRFVILAGISLALAACSGSSGSSSSSGSTSAATTTGSSTSTTTTAGSGSGSTASSTTTSSSSSSSSSTTTSSSSSSSTGTTTAGSSSSSSSSTTAGGSDSGSTGGTNASGSSGSTTGTSGSGGSTGGQTFTLTFNDLQNWCNSDIGGTSVAATALNPQTFSFPAGTIVNLSTAPENSIFVFGYWVGTDGDVGSPTFDRSATTTVTMDADKTIGVCCPFSSAPNKDCLGTFPDGGPP